MMRVKGTISKWIDTKGYGFIAADNGQQVFAHIKSFKRIQRNPVVGDVVTFEIVQDAAKGPQAYNIQYPEQESKGLTRRKSQNKKKRSYDFIYALIILAIIFFGWKKLKPFGEHPTTNNQSISTTAGPVEQFQCNGKTKCSEMKSCDEAVFYLKNCPGSVSDGDGDGIPCEDQWCGH